MAKKAGTVTFFNEPRNEDHCTEWSCSRCTYQNSSLESPNTCAMCDGPRHQIVDTGAIFSESDQFDVVETTAHGSNPEEVRDMMMGTGSANRMESSPETTGGGQLMISTGLEGSGSSEPNKDQGKHARQLQAELESCQTLSPEVLLKEVEKQVQGPSYSSPNWVIASLVVRAVEVDMKMHLLEGQNQHYIVFLEKSFDKLIRKALDVFDSGANTKRSWKTLNDHWRSIDVAGDGTEENTKSITEESSTNAPENVCQDSDVTPTKFEAPEKDFAMGYYQSQMNSAFEQLVRSSVSICMMYLEKQDTRKLDILDVLLDPKTQRYNHQTYSYTARTTNSWSLPSENIGAPHLHSLAVNTFLEIDGLKTIRACVLGCSKVSYTTPSILLAYLSIVLKNTSTFSGDYAQAANCLVIETVEVLGNWPLSLVLDHAEAYNKILDCLNDILDGLTAKPAESVTIEEDPNVDIVSEGAIRSAVKFLESDKLRFRRFGLDQLGKLCTTLTAKKKVPREMVTAYFKSLGVYHDIFGERMDERVVPMSEDLLQNSSLDVEILDLMLSNANSRAVRKLFSSILLFPEFTEDLVVHLLEQTTTSVLCKADLGSFKLLMLTLAGEMYLKQKIVKKGDNALLSCLDALWSLLFSTSVPINASAAKSPNGTQTSSKFGHTSRLAGAGSEADLGSMELGTDDKLSTVASVLNITSSQFEDILKAFSLIAKEAKPQIRNQFASRCLAIIKRSLGSASQPFSSLNPQSQSVLSPTDASSFGFFAVDEDDLMQPGQQPDQQVSSNGEEVSIESHHLAETHIDHTTPDAVLTAYKLVNTIILACPADTDRIGARRAVISDLDHRWHLKELILAEYERFLTTSQIRRAVDMLVHLSPSPTHKSTDDISEEMQMHQYEHEIGSFRRPNLTAHGLRSQLRKRPLLRRESSTVNFEEQQASAIARLTEHQNSRLVMLSTLLKWAKDKMNFNLNDMECLWRVSCLPDENDQNSGNFTSQETFMLWLRVLSFESRNGYVSSNLTASVLLDLFASRLAIKRVGPKTYHCLQAHFLSVNNAAEKFDATGYEAVRDEFKIQSSPPPTGLEGVNLVGRRVLVLFADGNMVRGKITKYSSWGNQHQIEYITGVIEEKEVQRLTKWFILPPLEASIAGAVQVKSVQQSMDVLGLETIWSVALENDPEYAQVATQAFSLLLALYRAIEKPKTESDYFLEEIFGALQDLSRLVASKEEFTDRQKHTGLLRRCLEFLVVYIVDAENSEFSRNNLSISDDFPLKLAGFGSGIPVNLSFTSKNERLNHSNIAMHSKVKVLDILSWLSFQADIKLADINLHVSKGEGLEGPTQPVVVNIRTAPRLANLLLEDIGISGISPVTISVEVVQPVKAKGSRDPTSLQMVPYETRTEPAAAVQQKDTLKEENQEMKELGKQPQSESSQSDPTSRFERSVALQDLAKMEFALSPAGVISAHETMGDILFLLLENSKDFQMIELSEMLQGIPPILRELEPLLEFSESMTWEGIFASRSTSKWRVVYLAHSIGALCFPTALPGELNIYPGTVSSERFIQSGGPAAILQLFNEFCRFWFTERPDVVDSAFPLLVDVVCASVAILGKSNPLSPILLQTAESLVQVILHGRDVLEKRSVEVVPNSSKKGCKCQGEFLGVEPRDLSSLSPAERSRLPPDVSIELLPLRPPVCPFCINTRRLARATIEAIHALELLVTSIDVIGTMLFGSSAKVKFFFSRKEASCSDMFVRKLLLNCVNKELRHQTRSFLHRVALATSEYRRTITHSLRKVESNLEKEDSSDTCDDFFDLFRVFVPDETIGVQEEDVELVYRITQLILDWPSKMQARDDSGAGVQNPKFFNQYNESETKLFVNFAGTLAHMVEAHDSLRERVTSIKVRSYIGEENDGRPVVHVLWEDYLMDFSHEQPFCDSRLSRDAVKGLLCSLVKNDLLLTYELISLIENYSNETAVPLKEEERGRKNVSDWQFDPTPSGPSTSVFKSRNTTGYVGLRNRGSTCYQNSLLQLLFHIPRFRFAISSAPVSPPNELASGNQGMLNSQALAKPKQEEVKVVVGWMCICSGINDLESNFCHICFTQKSENCEMVTETFQVDNAASSTPSSSSDGGLQNMEVLRQLQRTFRFMEESRKGCYDPIPFVEACSILKLTFPVTSQNDASEFFDKLLDNLEESLKGTEFLETMKECFLGNQTRLKRCHVCGTVSVSREESFYRFELMTKDNSVEKTSLQECLASFVAPEVLTGDNKVDCEQCQSRSPCTFVSCLTQLPDFLFIHPKRFSFDLMAMETVKLNHFIQFPRKLDLFPFTKIGQAVEAKQHQTKEAAGSTGQNTTVDFQATRFDVNAFWAGSQPLSDDEIESYKESCQYVLSGVLVHRGRAGGGHYYSFKRAGSGWFRFDDARVHEFDIDTELSEECFGGSFEKASSNTYGVKLETIEREWSAFMLLYERANLGTVAVSGRDPVGASNAS